jgi:hypothetical protein
VTAPSTTPDYPFPGCCAHTFNAHSRDRCLACECTRPPVQIGTPGQRPATTPGQDAAVEETEVADLRECGLCSALVRNAQAERHLEWHETLTHTLENLLLAAQRALAAQPRATKK